MTGEKVSDEALLWADVVCLTGMYVQAQRANEIARRARALGRVSVVGGPSVTVAPQRFGDVDILHVGELGNATWELIRRLDGSVTPPEQQERYTTTQAFALGDQPL